MKIGNVQEGNHGGREKGMEEENRKKEGRQHAGDSIFSFPLVIPFLSLLLPPHSLLSPVPLRLPFFPCCPFPTVPILLLSLV